MYSSEEYDIIVITPSGKTNDEIEIMKHSSKHLNKLPDTIWGFLLSSKLDVVLRIADMSQQLSEVATVQATSSTAEANEFWNALHEGQKSKKCWKFINTGLIDSYTSLWGIETLSHKGKNYLEPCLGISNPAVSSMRRKMFKSPKIIFAKMALHTEGYIDLKGEYSSANTNCVFDSIYSLCFLGALLNSSLMNFIYKEYFGALIMSGGYFQYQAPQIKTLPIPRISFTTPQKKRKKMVDEAIKLYQTEIKTIAINAGEWQNKDEVRKNDKSKEKKNSAGSRKVAKESRRYKLTKGIISKEDSGLGGEVHGVREGDSEYEPSEGTPQEGEDSTRPLNSTRFLETAQGIKSYSEVAETVAVSVAKTIEAIIEKPPDEIYVTPEWICRLHNDIAGPLFPDWAGRFRDINVSVGTHTPPPFFEVPVQVRLYCEDLTARLLFASEANDIEQISETLAYADWRFQWIHPFRDFNGRVGRVILTALLFKLGLPPAETASVEPGEKERYLKALREADAGDLSSLTEIWLDRLSKSFKERGD